MPGEETEPQQSKTLVAGETGYQGTSGWRHGLGC